MPWDLIWDRTYLHRGLCWKHKRTCQYLIFLTYSYHLLFSHQSVVVCAVLGEVDAYKVQETLELCDDELAFLILVVPNQVFPSVFIEQAHTEIIMQIKKMKSYKLKLWKSTKHWFYKKINKKWLFKRWIKNRLLHFLLTEWSFQLKGYPCKWYKTI